MKRSADYETDNNAISIRPNMVDYEDGRRLGYITIFTSTSKMHINAELVKEVREILEAIEEQYLTKKD